MRSRQPATLLLIAIVGFGASPALAQNCPSAVEARALEGQRDPFGTYCMRSYQADFARRKCSTARSALDLDECQYLSESLVRASQDCARLGGPYAARCATLAAEGKNMLGAVNQEPVLLQHRQEQRSQQNFGNSCRANIGVQCMGQCGGDTTCQAQCNSGNAWRCN
jgi:hypothetical protein